VSKVCFSFVPLTLKNKAMKTKNDFLEYYELEELMVLLDDIYAGFLKSERGSAAENETAFWLIQLVKRWLSEPEDQQATE
jgi:hypothetical protein